jgi:hypothetical protein
MTTAVAAALIAGIVCGLVPLIYGLRRGQTGLAVGGFVACLVGGFVLGLFLAVPLAALFTWLIWRKGHAARPAAAEATSEPWAGRTDAVGPASAEPRFERTPEREPTARP